MIKFRADVDYEETVNTLEQVRKPTLVLVDDYKIKPKVNDQSEYDIIEDDDDNNNEDR